MAYGEPKARGIYCIETVWEDEPADRSSVRGILEVLHSRLGAPFLHRDAATTTEFHRHVEDWLGTEPNEYPILYLAFHGSDSGQIWFKTVDGKKDVVNYGVLADRLDDRCAGRAVHVGACSVLAEVDTADSVARTAASAVSGYVDDIDWMLSTAFDLLVLEELQYHGGKSLTHNVARQAEQNLTNDDQPFAGVRRELGFSMTTQ